MLGNKDKKKNKEDEDLVNPPEEEAKQKPKSKKAPAGVKHNFDSYLSAHSVNIDKYDKSYISTKHKGENLTADEWEEIINKETAKKQ